MRSIALLAWRYVSYHRLRSGILACCIALVAFLPIAVEILITHYQHTLTKRASSTPLLVGAKGSRFDLLMSSLYFKGKTKDTVTWQDCESIAADRLCTTIPLYVRNTAKGHPVVGTSFEYFDFRELKLDQGTYPLQLGDTVLGAHVARDLALGPGDHLISDTEKLYDLSASYPLRMRIVGVLEEAGSADDRAVFVDTKTAWVIAGIGHGHQDIESNPDWVLDKKDGHVSGNAAVFEYNEITSKTLETFHFHGGSDTLPLTAIVVLPRDKKSFTIVKARLAASKTLQPLLPAKGIEELLEFVFQAKRFFDANMILVTVATSLFLALVVLLTVRVRQREIETLTKIGASRSMIVRLLATELLMVVTAGLACAAGLAAVGSFVAIRYGLVF